MNLWLFETETLLQMLKDVHAFVRSHPDAKDVADAMETDLIQELYTRGELDPGNS
jgi:hypothetical protein